MASYNPHYLPHRKKKFVFWSVIIIILLFLGYAYANNLFGLKTSFQTQIGNLSNSQGSQNSIENLCKQEYQSYSKIGEQKYGVTFSLIKIQGFESQSEVNNFVNIYGTGDYRELEQFSGNFPMVGISASYYSPSAGSSFPELIGCNSNGKLTSWSINVLTNPAI